MACFLVGAAEAVVPTKISLIQELDNLWHRLSSNLTTRLGNARNRIENINIKSPRQMVMERAQRLDDITRTLGIIINAKMVDARRSIEHSGQMLNSLGYKNVLARGYAIVRDKDNTIISSATNADKIATVEFADGVAKI